MKKILLVLSMAFCILTSFTSSSVQGDVAWIVSPSTVTVTQGNMFIIDVTIYKTHGEFTSLALKATSSDSTSLPILVVKNPSHFNDKVIYQIMVDARTLGTYTIDINLSGSYNYNGTVSFNQDKTARVTVVH